MKKLLLYGLIPAFGLVCLSSCSGLDNSTAVSSEELVVIFPDYTGITVPPNIAPLNFFIDMEGCRFVVDFIGENGYTFSISTKQNVEIPMEKWRKLLSENMGKSYHVQIYRKFNNVWEKLSVVTNKISIDPIDPYLTYRLTPPGYDIWWFLNIQQRHLESFEVVDVMNNNFSIPTCINCHTPNQHNPDEFVMHARGEFPGTIIYKDGEFMRINTRTEEMKLPGSYLTWHPSGRFLAFAVLRAMIYFHADVFERHKVWEAGNPRIALLDLETMTMMASQELNTMDTMTHETYPAWSSDGKWLYFCKAIVPDGFDTVFGTEKFLDLQMNLLRVPFDEKNIAFGKAETVVDAVKLNKSASQPKTSPNGRWMTFVMAGSGQNPTWRNDANLYIMDLQTMDWWPLAAVNSDNDADYYTSWSSNSRWIVFASRRKNGLVTLSHFAHIDENGNAKKSFVLPQKDPRFYKSFLRSFSVTEFATGKVKPTVADIEAAAKGPLINVKFGWTNDGMYNR